MTHEWKPGDRAMVIVDRVVSNGMLNLKSKDGISPAVWIEALHPLPTPAPITDLERAVVEAAVKWRKNHSAPFISDEPTANLYAAVLALPFARTPPDPVGELRDAWDGLCNHMSGTETAKQRIDRVSRAIAALEAARKVGK